MEEGFRYGGQLFVLEFNPKAKVELCGPWFFCYEERSLRCSDGYSPIQAVQALNKITHGAGIVLDGRIYYQSLSCQGIIHVTENVIQVLKSQELIYIPLKRSREEGKTDVKRVKDDQK